MYRNHDYEMNNDLEDIPEECSLKKIHFKTTKLIWRKLMLKLSDKSDMKVEVDLVTKNNKPTHPIVKSILYAKAKEQYLAGHGFEFAFYRQHDCKFDTLVCFCENNHSVLSSKIDFDFVR